jgi:hypothetical protein
MDKVQRHFARSTLYGQNPFEGLNPEERLNLIRMPSTFRERWRLSRLWTDRRSREAVIADIMAERRLLYEMTSKATLQRSACAPTSNSASAGAHIGAELHLRHGADSTALKSLSPYYKYRQDLQFQAFNDIVRLRAEQDATDLRTIPEAKVDHEQRLARRKAFLDIQVERAKLELREAELMASVESGPVPDIQPEPAPRQRQAMG